MASYERHEWLARRVEEAIDPDQRIVDPHHHLWNRDGSVYLASELVADTRAAHNVTHTVFVECSASYDSQATAAMAPVGETRFVVEQADAAAGAGTCIAAIVGHADLTLGAELPDVLAAHVEAGDGLFRGVRHGVNWSPHHDVKNGHHNPSPNQLAAPAFRDGVRQLAARGLSFDAWLYFDQLTELAEMANAIPECTIVVNHLGGPLGIGPHASTRAEMREHWRIGITSIANCPNAVIKVGGIGMEHYFGTPWADLDAPPSSEQVAEYWSDMVRFAIDSFGPDRAMFESNFPVDRQTLPYTVLWNAFQIMASEYSDMERNDLFAGTADRVYRIGPAS